MATFEKGGRISLAREKDPIRWPEVQTKHVFRDPYPGWGPDRACRDLPHEWFDVDPEGRDRDEFLADLETGERVCLDCPLAVECRDQAMKCRAKGLFGAVVTTESGNAWPVDVWVRMKTGGKAPRKKAPTRAPELRKCAWEGCPKVFPVSVKKIHQKYCSQKCGKARKAHKARQAAARSRTPLAQAS